MKTIINISNYEEFLIDFLDGNLDEATHAQVLLFLKENPDIAEEFEGVNDFKVEDCFQSFDDKDSLKVVLENKIIINSDNYSHYFVAYHEGDLSSDEIIQVDDFIELNPQLENDFEVFAKVASIKPAEISFEHKDELRLMYFSDDRYISLSEFETLCVDYIEGNLLRKESDEFINAIEANDELNSIFSLFQKTKLQPDYNVVFDNKSVLYKRRFIGVVPMSQYISSVAAAVALLFIFNVYNFKLDNIDVQNKLPISANKTEKVIENNGDNVTKAAQEFPTDVQDKTNIIENSILEQKNPSKKSNAIKEAKRGAKRKHYAGNISMMKLKGLTDNINIHELVLDETKLLQIDRMMVDTGNFLITSDTEVSSLASNGNEDEKLTGVNRVKNKITRIIAHEREYIENTEPKAAFRRIAQLAVKGFNKLTERDISYN